MAYIGYGTVESRLGSRALCAKQSVHGGMGIRLKLEEVNLSADLRPFPDEVWPVLNRTAIGGPRGSLPDYWDRLL